MANPWLKKNPFMSLWLTSANRVAGSVRGRLAAEAKHQAALATHRATTDLVTFWAGAGTSPLAAAAPAKRRRPRK